MNLMSGSAPIPQNDAPQVNSLEVTLFGSGYGESSVIHYGDGNWIIVDSCIARDSTAPAALRYLESIGVDVASQVKAVVITHWHDDHIKGVSEIAERCVKAEFFLSSALMTSPNKDKFLKLVLDSAASRLTNLVANSTSGITEFSKTLDTLKKTGRKLGYAQKDTLLMDGKDFQLWALAPHTSIFEKSIEAIIAQIPDAAGAVTRVKAPTPNFASVVLWLKFKDCRILLGADLEEASEHKGWSLIIEEMKTTVIDKKAELFKVAHHGSVTGHHPKIWTELLADKPVCVIAPFNKPPKLPNSTDVERILGHSKDAFVTSSPHKQYKAKKLEDSTIKRKLAGRNAVMAYANYSYIRARRNDDAWDIKMFGERTTIKRFRSPESIASLRIACAYLVSVVVP